MIGRAGRILVEHGRVVGLAMEDGDAYGCRALVVTTGTFLNGLIHIGPEQRPAGRAGEPPSRELAESLKSFGFEWGRLKTGTPPRLDRESIDFDAQVASGHVSRSSAATTPPVPFSFLTGADRRGRRSTVICSTRTIACAIWCARTSTARRSSTARFSGIGPRYCPSLEDKIVRFPDKERHQIFLEPEGVDAREIYVNGFSMSLPRDVQADLVHALPGLEDAVLLRPGYAVEYDFIQPTELTRRARDEARRRALSRRADQRHVRLRRGGGAGARGRASTPRSAARGASRIRAAAATRRTSASSSTT